MLGRLLNGLRAPSETSKPAASLHIPRLESRIKGVNFFVPAAASPSCYHASFVLPAVCEPSVIFGLNLTQLPNSARDTFICNECDSTNAPVLSNGPSPLHEPSHITVRLVDTHEEKFEQDATDVTIKRLEALEKALQDRVNVLEERLNKIDGKLEERFSSLETLLRQLIGVKEASV